MKRLFPVLALSLLAAPALADVGPSFLPNFTFPEPVAQPGVSSQGCTTTQPSGQAGVQTAGTQTTQCK